MFKEEVCEYSLVFILQRSFVHKMVEDIADSSYFLLDYSKYM